MRVYTSKSAQPGDPYRKVEDAIREVWSSIWYLRAFEEREYRSIPHQSVGMAILVHRAFPDEEANGVALTANPFDTSGLEPAFYINVQKGEASVGPRATRPPTSLYIIISLRVSPPFIYDTRPWFPAVPRS